MVIAIDGPSGSGKTSTAKLLSKRLNFYYCDSGSLYRAITYYLVKKEVSLDNSLTVINELKDVRIEYDILTNKILLNNIDVTSFLRSEKVTENVSKVSSMKIIRDFLIITQRRLAEDNDIIVDGRDIGTTVFPNADYKFYIDADIETRAKRRFRELDVKDNNYSYKDILEMIKKRDFHDQNRKYSPLKKAKDAISIDTTMLGLTEQVDKIINIIKN